MLTCSAYITNYRFNFHYKNFKFIFSYNISKAEERSALNLSVSGIVLTKCFTCVSVVFDLFCIKLFMFQHWQEFKYKMLAVTVHLADYVRCLSLERWWHCHQMKQHSDKFEEESWGHNFIATLRSQRQKKKWTTHQEWKNIILCVTCQIEDEKTQQVLLFITCNSLSFFFLQFCTVILLVMLGHFSL